ncbi:putative L-ornithine N(5)-oxygenase [Seiridium unicorne]|uniref:L-ornithine N(5)-oxygenase n=1 Tax=Seiridium unicorne TaxID=138068 RepID=A0ABR2VES7_9PEZI
MDPEKASATSYSQFACIGAGFSAIGLGATLKRWYGITDIQFFERHGQLGGTWYVNQYPGCACDVPSVLYSFSFEPNPDWTRILPSNAELKQYLDRVSDKYDLTSKMTFGVNVEGCEWIEERSSWRLRIRRYETGEVLFHESQFLFSGSGQLVTPREIDVPGASAFKGPIFHSARWRNDVDLTGKKVVVFGNGCTAAQIVPNIVAKTEHTTQIVRAQHWILPPIDMPIPPWMRFMLRNIPGALQLFRFLVFAMAERQLRGLPMTESAARFREKMREKAEKYMRKTAPAKYHDILIPDFEVGCKRRIFDSGYLNSLHSSNMTLTDSPALEIVPEGVRTKDGIIPADAIVLANGFATNHFFDKMQIVGRGGETVGKHWHDAGGPTAYNSSVISGFPNFFVLLGPNAATGHTSALMAAENSINYALRVIKPVLDGKASVVDLKKEAEDEYTERVQKDLENTVWNSGCQSWYVKDEGPGKRWNAMSYPWTQSYFWYRSRFPVWRDWRFSGEMKPQRSGWLQGIAVFGVLCITSGWWLWGQNVNWRVLAATLQDTVFNRTL